MKFFKIVNGICRDNDPKRKIFPSAYLAKEMVGAEYIGYGSSESDANYIPFEKSIHTYQFREDAPVFDYFVLKENYGVSRKKFDWIKLDIYDFVTNHMSAIGGAFLVSDRFKEIISSYHLPRHKFYPAKLMFQGQKLDYYLFQLGEELTIRYAHCLYQIEGEGKNMTAQELQIHDKESFNFKWIALNKEGKRLEIQEFVFSNFYDYFISKELFKVVSEPLKEALESAGLTEGWKFEDISPRTITFLS
jgi:hypothetical protein